MAVACVAVWLLLLLLIPLLLLLLLLLLACIWLVSSARHLHICSKDIAGISLHANTI